MNYKEILDGELKALLERKSKLPQSIEDFRISDSYQDFQKLIRLNTLIGWVQGMLNQPYDAYRLYDLMCGFITIPQKPLCLGEFKQATQSDYDFVYLYYGAVCYMVLRADAYPMDNVIKQYFRNNSISW